MQRIEIGDLQQQSLLLMDSAPIIYFLESHPSFGPRFKPVVDAHTEGRVQFAEPRGGDCTEGVFFVFFSLASPTVL